MPCQQCRHDVIFVVIGGTLCCLLVSKDLRQEVENTTTNGVTSDDKNGMMTTLSFQCKFSILLIEISHLLSYPLFP